MDTRGHDTKTGQSTLAHNFRQILTDFQNSFITDSAVAM